MNTDMQVLVVDDFSTMRKILRNMLKEIGFTKIDEAESGEEALAKLRAGKFGLIFSDWNMPSMSGLDLLKAVRADEGLCAVPFMMVMAESKRENVVAAASAGATSYLIKPFSAETLREKLFKAFPN